jgi:hypothetical protein
VPAANLDLMRPLGIRVDAVAPQLPRTRPSTGRTRAPDLLAHVLSPEAVADIIANLVSDAAAVVSGAVVPAGGA